MHKIIILLLTLISILMPSFAESTLQNNWKLQIDSDKQCIAKSINPKGLELTRQKLTVTTKDTADLKSFQVLVNDQIVIPLGRANLTDTSCKCIRIRNMSALTTDNAIVRIHGTTERDTPIDATIQIKDLAKMIQVIKSESCGKSQN